MYINRRTLIRSAFALAGVAGFTRAGFADIDVAKLNEPWPGDMAMGPDKAKVTVIEFASAGVSFLL